MRVRLKAYGEVRRHLQALDSSAEIQLDDGCSVRRLLDLLGIPHGEVWRVSVNGELASEDHLLQDGDEIGVFSPVGGG